MNLQGAHALVTGGASGLGRATVDALRERQARVTVFDIDAGGMAALRVLDPPVAGWECDVTDESAVAGAVARVVAEQGTPDVLVNNAGVLFSAPLVRLGASGLETHTTQDWNSVLALNLTAVFVMTRAVVSEIIRARKKGVIVNISSVAAAGNPGQSAYAASKAGVNALTAVWARELGPMGIRVAGVSPGFSDTPSTRAAMADAVLAEVLKRVPLRRLGQAREIAQAVVAVIENDFFTGKTLEIDGGLVV